MLTLLLLLISGATFAYLSHSNLELVSLHFGPYVLPNIPLFYVIVGALIVGMSLSYVLYLWHFFSTSLTLRNKNHEIADGKEAILDLTKRVHQLELENEKLKHEPVIEVADDDAL